MADKSALLAALAPREEIVELAGHRVRVRELASAAQSERLQDPGDAFYAALVLCCFDPETGERLFDEADIPTLKGSARKGMKPLVDAVIRVNGLDEALEEKNSGAGPAAG
jgi:hypothetical protein